MLAHILNVIHSTVREHVSKTISRSNEWPKVRKEFLETHTSCEACGSQTLLQVHHCMPFHDDPSLELNPNNFVTLCMSKKECHIILGHGGSFKMFNPHIKEDCEILLKNPDQFEAIAAKAKANRKINAPGNK